MNVTTPLISQQLGPRAGGASNKNGKIIEKKVSTFIDRHTAGKCTGRSADFDGPSLFLEKVNN